MIFFTKVPKKNIDLLARPESNEVENIFGLLDHVVIQQSNNYVNSFTTKRVTLVLKIDGRPASPFAPQVCVDHVKFVDLVDLGG